jgi:hypothetical protein
MGLRERLQTVTQFFQKATTRGRRLREEDERSEDHASSVGEQTHQREESHQGAMTAEDRNRTRAGQQRDRGR